METDKLFVIGSFCKGSEHYKLISEFVTECKQVFVLGSAYRLKVGYPVFVNRGLDQVPGCELQLEKPELSFQVLDEFLGYNAKVPEKSIHVKTKVLAKTPAGQETECLTYAYNFAKLPKTAHLIERGDWGSSLERYPVVNRQLTERQKEYIRKLGASKGREIVPIKLDLYRELLNLDIVVDKGRRLALSPLGKEVYQFLF